MQDATNMSTRDETQHTANVSRDHSRQVNGKVYDSRHRDRNNIHIEKYENHSISYLTSDSSHLPSRCTSTCSRNRASTQADEENNPVHQPPSTAGRSHHLTVVENDPASASRPQRAPTWTSVKHAAVHFYCKNPRSLLAIIGVLLVAAILAIVLPLYFTADARLKRSLAEMGASAEQRTWFPQTAATFPTSDAPALASSRGTPLAYAASIT
ncbi:hypothetical protein SLS57_001645 [Botryosphaeria dothidea]